jgi:tetrahydromethanopterin S-methyltransferase subunit G
MPNDITKDDLTKLEENLGRMIAKGFEGVDKRFNENTEQHRQIFNRLDRIEMKLEGVVYRREFDELKGRMDELENLLAIQRKK